MELRQLAVTDMNTLPRNSNFLNPPIVLTVVASFPLVLVFVPLQRDPDHVAGYYNCSPCQRETAIMGITTYLVRFCCMPRGRLKSMWHVCLLRWLNMVKGCVI